MKDPQLGHAQPSNKLHEENPQKANKNVNEHSKTSKSSKPLPAEFKVTSWWNSCFRLVLQVGGSLASFARSFFRKPVMPFEEKATAVMWPMPLPYPAVMKRSAVDPICSNDVSFQCGVNLAVLMLNWLHLKRPSTCPAEITLYAPLSRLQWRVVRQVELTMNAWRDAEPVTAFNMGRAAAKVENIERALERLCTFESGLFELFDEALPDSSSSLSRSASRKFFAPGLQADGGGDIVGQSSSCGGSVAKPIIADRLDFRGVPKFDPKPFLDKQGRFIFDDPLSAALKPEDAVEDPPQVKLFGDACELWKLFQKLDATGRLGAIPDTKVLPGFQAGLFAVGKDESKDRLIFDSRPFNTLESPPNRWIKSMAAASSLVEVHLEPGEVCVVSGTDLREFYYSFEVGNSRLIRNSLLFLTTAKEIWDWNCCTEEIRQHPGKIWLGLRTLAMGDTCAVELAQTAHVGILRQMGLIRENNLLTMSMSVPRVPSFIGIVIDDLIAFEKIARAALSTSEMTKSEETVRSAVGRFADLGLIPHDGKTFYNDLHAEFWGATFDGDSGYVRAGLKRMIPILFATVGILKLGLCSISLLQVLVGCWTSAFLFRRRMLSIFNVVYEVFQRASKQSDVIRLSEALKEELMLCVSLCPLAATFLRTRTSSQVYASDASSVGWAVISADIPNWLASEVHRHALRKRVWTKLLSPSKSLLKERGVLEPSEELPAGEAFATHPLWSLIAGGFQFQTLKSRRTKAGRHINIDEMIGMLEAEKSAVETGFPVRYFSLADSQVSLGALLKGRSSSIGLNALLQESLAVHLSTSVVPSFGFLPSKENPADDPTRGVPLRSPVHELPEWMKKQSSFSPHEAVAELDKWLDARNSSPWHLSGLPDLSELDGDFVESQMWKRSCRQAEFLHKKRMLSVSPKPSVVKKSFCKHCTVLPEEEVVAGSSRFDFSAHTFSVEAKDAKTDVLIRSYPSASSLNLLKLSVEAQNFLRSLPREQFVFPKSWNVDKDWVPDFPGYLDLYSGKKGIASAVVQSGKAWALTFEIEESEAQDLSLPSNRTLVQKLIQLSAVHTVGAAIFCRSFSRAVRPPVRTKQEPLGIASMTTNMQHKVSEGNDHASWLASIISLCIAKGIHFWVENPDSSFLWYCPDWTALGANDKTKSFRLDYCVCGCPWRKRTRFFTDLHLRGQFVFCNRSHKHLRLVGWSRVHQKPWTRVAQVYPRRLVHWVASAILIDAGLLPGRKHLNISSICFQNHGRIGEAKKPGPRRAVRSRRVLQTLLEADIVEPETALLGERIWFTFKNWALKSLSEAAFNAVVSCPDTLCLLIECFGMFLFEEGHSIYLLRQLITFVQRWKPNFRGSLRGAWQLVSKWELIQPIRHRTPLPLVVYRAMVSVALSWGWYRWSAVTMLAFEGICRPGEPLTATRGDLLLPRDLLLEDASVVYLQIRNPKGRRRGIGATQHSKISNLRLVLFLDKVFGRLDRSVPLFGGSFASYRKRWDLLLSFLKIPQRLSLTPASLRAGGAVRAYRANEEIARLMWRMRLRNIDTLQHYLQETGAASIFAELPPESRHIVHLAALMFDVLLDTFGS